MLPKMILGGYHKDSRGVLKYNNNFDASEIKRIYFIENVGSDYIRGWQGHKIEKRWFSAVQGKFLIQLIKIDNWINPSKDLKKSIFKISGDNADILFIPGGYITSIQAIENNSRLLVMSDYRLNEINDEFKFPLNYF